MISVCMLGGAGGSTASVTRYYLTPDHACGLGYYTEHDQVPGQWRGAGAAALGLTGDLQADGAARLGQLLNAQSPDGELLARPVWRADPAGRLPLAPLVEALQHLADARGVPVHEVVANPVDRGALLVILQRSEQRTPTPDLGALPGPDESPAGLATATARLATPLATRLPTGIPAGTAAVLHGVTVDAALAGRLATGADLDPVQVLRSPDGTDRFTPALAKAGAKVDIRRVVGIDVTVSAPKSVSVLHGLADPNTAALIELCHDRAITQALGYLQRHAGHGLRGHHGDGQQMHHVATDGWIAASFARYTSRAGDPQLHTHLVIPNLLHGQDGTWSAIDSRAVFRNAKTAGFLYQAALRHELTRELHVTWTPPVKGLAEICGVPREVLREFSQRRQQIEAALRHTGRRGRAAQDACLATRQPKQRTSLAALRESWQQRAEALGASPEGLLTAARITHPPRDRASWQQRLNRLLRAEQPAPARDLLLSPEQIAHVAALVLGPDGVTAKTTGFDRRDLLQVLAVTVPVEHTGNALDLEHLADHLLRQPGPVPVHPGAEEEPRWTTLELLATEQRALALAASPNRTKVAEPEVVAQLLEGRGWLSPEQQSVIGQIAGDTRLATVLVGPAGSGKTAVLATIAALANQSEQPIVGCALAALTAARLQHDSAIPSTSLARLPGSSPPKARATLSRRGPGWWSMKPGWSAPAN